MTKYDSDLRFVRIVKIVVIESCVLFLRVIKMFE